jgi:rRNA small subunit pseudouridine methyltransferase Nep1
LLNCDDHRDICRKKLKRDPNEFRPDILHGELLALLDSPINKAGHLKIYIQTTKHVLIDVNPAIRIPRTYKRFAGLMVQLLHKMKIKAGNDSTTLLKVIKNPFSSHMPAGTRCYGMSCQGKLYSPLALAPALAAASPETQATHPLCFIVGAMSTGHVTLEDHPYMEEMFSISAYPLSGASALSRIMGGLEHHWGIV